MNMVYKEIRQRGSMSIMPGSAVETMGLDKWTDIAAMTEIEEQADDENE
jgi:hypothetical protein